MHLCRGGGGYNKKNTSTNPLRDLPTPVTKLLKYFHLSALHISCAVSVEVFALDSPEREKRIVVLMYSILMVAFTWSAVTEVGNFNDALWC